MILAAIIAVLIAILLTLLRALLGPTVFDRILAVNMMGTSIVVFVALLGFLNERPQFLDVAVVYALVNFVATIAILKLVEYGRLG